MPDNVPAAAPSATDASPVAAAHHVMLPTFSTTKAAPWFQRVEALFRIKKIPATLKADFIIGALPEDVFDRISTWIAEFGTDSIDYDVLKAKIITCCQPSPEEKSQKVLELLRMPLGDQRPSDAYFELKNLVTVLNPDGTTSIIDLMRVMWMTRLPAEIRAQMTDFSTKTEDELTKQADALRGTSRFALSSLSPPATVASAAADLTDSMSHLGMEDDGNDVIAASHRPPPRHNRQSQYRQQQRPHDAPRRQFCHYHRKFGKDAIRCQQPCSFHKQNFYSKNM